LLIVCGRGEEVEWNRGSRNGEEEDRRIAKKRKRGGVGDYHLHAQSFYALMK
jgi:hypothetical protein